MADARLLQKYSLFGGLEKEQIESILPLMQEETFSSGDVIITEDKLNDKIFFITKGQVAVTKKDTLLTCFGEGEAFGEMEVLDVMPAVATIKALSTVNVLSISNRGIRDIYKQDIKAFSLMIMNLARDLSRRLRKMDDLMASQPKPVMI